MVEAQSQQSDQAQTFFQDTIAGSIRRSVLDTPETFRPHPGTMLVKPDPPKTETDGGLVIPDRAEHLQKRRTGTVLAFTPGAAESRRAMEDARPLYAVGDRVLFREPGVEAKIIFKDVGECYLLQFRGGIDDEVLGKFDRPRDS